MWAPVVLCGSSFLSGCTGVLDANEQPGAESLGREDSPASHEQLVESCEEEHFLLSSQLRRLSEEQIRNSIRDTFGSLFEPSVFPSMDDGARLIGMNLIADKLNVNALNFERLYESSRQVSDIVIAQNPEFVACADSTSPDCVAELAAKYMHRLWRGQDSEADLSDLEAHLAELGTNSEKLEFVVNALVLGSKFLFRSEMGAVSGDGRELNNYEVVAFLSYAIWNSTPDEELLSLAGQSEGLTDVQIAQQIDRMVQDKRVDDGLVELYKDYLKLDLVMSRPKDSAFEFSSEVRTDLLVSAEMMLKEHIEANAEFMSVFSDAPMPVNQTIAGFFGVTSDSEAMVSTEVSNRNGVLTHPAFLSVHSTLSESGIVKRGVFTLEQLLCIELPDPPNDISSLETPPDLDPETTSERELLQATHSSQAECVGCHQYIDPAGFGFENYDAVGRYREVEKESVPIDASGTLDDVGSYGSSVEFTDALVNSDSMRACVSRRFLEHYFGQELEEEACVVTFFSERLGQSDGSVRSLLHTLSDLQTFIRSRSQ